MPGGAGTWARPRRRLRPCPPVRHRPRREDRCAITPHAATPWSPSTRPDRMSRPSAGGHSSRTAASIRALGAPERHPSGQAHASTCQDQAAGGGRLVGSFRAGGGGGSRTRARKRTPRGAFAPGFVCLLTRRPQERREGLRKAFPDLAAEGSLPSFRGPADPSRPEERPVQSPTALIDSRIDNQTHTGQNGPVIERVLGSRPHALAREFPGCLDR